MPYLVDLLQTVILAGTVVWAVRAAVLAGWQPTLVVRIETASADEETVEETPAPPLHVLEYCAQESEPFMREQLLNDVHEAYREHQNWDAALAAVMKRYGA